MSELTTAETISVRRQALEDAAKCVEETLAFTLYAEVAPALMKRIRELGQPGDTVFVLPLRGGERFGLSRAMYEEFMIAFPSANVMRELNGMRTWLLANPHRAKTKAHILRFVRTWLAKAHDQGSTRKAGAPTHFKYANQ